MLVRDRELLLRSFRILPDYLRDAEVSGDREVNFGDLGIQLTRSARALKIWVSLQYFGLDAFRATIDRCLDLAQLAADEIEGSPELEVLSAPTLGVVCFRRRPPGVEDEAELARVNSAVVARLAASGQGMISSTRLDGRYALRLCVLNHASGRGRRAPHRPLRRGDGGQRRRRGARATVAGRRARALRSVRPRSDAARLLARAGAARSRSGSRARSARRRAP